MSHAKLLMRSGTRADFAADLAPFARTNAVLITDEAVVVQRLPSGETVERRLSPADGAAVPDDREIRWDGSRHVVGFQGGAHAVSLPGPVVAFGGTGLLPGGPLRVTIGPVGPGA